jgi:hypothetical protein
MARSHRRLIGRRPDLPVAFTQVVERALSADLHERYATAGEMADALHSIFNPPAAVTPRQPTSNRLWRRLATAVAVSIVVVAIGMLNSLAFDYGLGRADFVDESISVWAWWGIRSVLGMTFTLLLAVFGLAALLSVHRVALASSRRCRGVHERVVALGSRLGGRLHLDDSQTWGPLLLILSGALLVGAWIAYQPLLADLLLAGDLPSAPADKLHLLSPVNRLYQNDYRKTFTGVVLAVGAAWYLVWRSQPTSGDRFQRVWLAGLGAVFVLAIFSLNLPFRLLYHAQFDAVRWHGAGCYLLGERNREALIFCPTLTPRNRIVADAPGEIERLQRKENIFTSF